MPLSLYAVTIPSFQQGLASVLKLLDKAESHCADNGLHADDIIQARLADDMHPFAYQVKSCAHHSLGAIEGVRAGAFSPDMAPPPSDFAGLKTRISDTQAALEAITADELENLIGRDMRFSIGSMNMDFTAENFLLSFSLPNFYFHATTAYGILRWKGLPVGKRDYLGRPRLKE